MIELYANGEISTASNFYGEDSVAYDPKSPDHPFDGDPKVFGLWS